MVAFIVARRWCIALQRNDRDRVVGARDGRHLALCIGGVHEKHQLLEPGEVYLLTARDAAGLNRAAGGPEDDPQEPTRKERARAQVGEALFGDSLPPLTSAKRREAEYGNGAAREPAEPSQEETEVADGHQYDGRRAVTGYELRKP